MNVRALSLLLLLASLLGCPSGPEPIGPRGKRSGSVPDATNGGSLLPPPPPLPPRRPPDRIPSAKSIQKDLLREGMVLALQVTNEPALSLKEVRVGSDGKIFVPFLGRTTARGLTPLQLANQIGKAFVDRGYLRDAQINLVVLERSGRRVYVLGRVGRPGSYDLPFDRDLRLTQLIAMAGGLATARADLAADPSAIRLIRTIDGKRKTFRISFTEIVDQGRLALDVRLQDGDLIYIPPKQELFIFGSVNKPGGFALADGSRLGIGEVLALAGGLGNKADDDGILLVRRGPRGAETYQVPSDPVKRAAVEVVASDTIIVPTRSIRRAYVLGAVANQGGITLDAPDLTVTKVLTLAGGPTRIAASNSVQLIRRGPDGKKRVYDVPVADIIRSGDLDRDPVVQPGDIIWVPEGFF